MSGLYAPNGSINLTVVTGTTYTGIYAPDGSLNVIQSPGTIYVGAYHPCGAAYVSIPSTSPVPIRAPDGSLYVDTINSTNVGKGQPVTVVSGSLGPVTGGLYYYYLGF